MYPTSRTSFAAVLGIVGMFLLTLSTAFGWNPEIINGVQYIPMSEVRTHYKLTRERTEGRQKVYEVPEKIQIRIQARSQEMFMNNMKFVLSYPVADHPSKGLMVSNMDLHKIIDPVLRPTYIANRRSFNTVVIDPGHGGHCLLYTSTLKALGYTKAHIAMKYIIYASIASVCGGIFGAVIGMIIFPTVIYNAWGIMYNMPSVQLQAQIPLAATAILLALSLIHI